MPDVSILVPAYNPRYIGLAIQSAIEQVGVDFEIIISDDRNDSAIESIVQPYLSSKVRYVKNPTQGPGRNRDYLLSLAQGEFIKFLFDDDLLLNNCLSTYLKAATESNAEAVFSTLAIIDSENNLKGAYPPVQFNVTGLLSKETFAKIFVFNRVNAIGGLSAVMVRRSFFERERRPFAANGRSVGYLTDVALYSNLVLADSTVVGIPGYYVAFRVHDQQTSSANNPLFAIGVVEWEIFIRQFRQLSLLSQTEFNESLKNQCAYYAQLLPSFPSLKPFIDNLVDYELSEMRDHEFYKELSKLYETIELETGKQVVNEEY
ncbi:MAG: glycosyltransferase family A protein [Actinomycetota bacterium]|nr:glycosyltransferase family A protein [Actinomycetota bacterium]